MVPGRVAGAAIAALVASSAGVGGGAGECFRMRAEGRFAPPSALVPSDAVTYDMDLVPAAAFIEVEQKSDANGTRVRVRVRDVQPGHAYGAHVHTAPCGPRPEDAGPRYQHVLDPDRVDPANEVWLDFTADARGEGTASAHHGWGFRPGEARSVVVHGAPGGAGERVACFSVPFGPQPRG
ncbi:superoxide dismutase family protein [Streptomyces sp. H27-C3]|uniref:superoxide dismutase family protein n=1 Tax=Streptomyces sp. H27-C3 TaxID=3046305 RepID=UPI0024BA15AB|nr:superoxide dismutase family protein [Streptomyces sp. H27-C3]MDJ0462903.1 superoxide dismutase family protein [Streptomyces sp. H27-C3]